MIKSFFFHSIAARFFIRNGIGTIATELTIKHNPANTNAYSYWPNCCEMGMPKHPEIPITIRDRPQALIKLSRPIHLMSKGDRMVEATAESNKLKWIIKFHLIAISRKTNLCKPRTKSRTNLERKCCFSTHRRRPVLRFQSKFHKTLSSR